MKADRAVDGARQQLD